MSIQFWNDKKVKHACNAPLLSRLSYRTGIESWNRGSLHVHARDIVDVAKLGSGIVVVVKAAMAACVRSRLTD